MPNRSHFDIVRYGHHRVSKPGIISAIRSFLDGPFPSGKCERCGHREISVMHDGGVYYACHKCKHTAYHTVDY